MSGLVTRRSALTGSAVAAMGLAAGVSTARASPVLSPNDARLVAIAAELAALEQEMQAYTVSRGVREWDPDHDPIWDALLDGFGPREVEMAGLPADTMAGVLAKAQASRQSSVAGCENGIDASVVDDLLRLFGNSTNPTGGHHA